MSTRHLTTRQVASKLGERSGTVARWAKRGWIDAWKNEGEWQIPRREVERIQDERFRQRQNGEKPRSPKPKRPPPRCYD